MIAKLSRYTISRDFTSTLPVLEAARAMEVHNYIGGKFTKVESGEYLDVLDPSDASVIGRVGVSTKGDVDAAVKAAKEAFEGSWSHTTIKSRAALMLKFHGLVRDHAQELAELIVQENGKNISEALGDVAKGNETVEWACSLPQVAAGRTLLVSSGVSCTESRTPLGVVASIVPFNFPFMVPMWTVPIAIVMGNTVVLKPSEKVPLTMQRVASLFEEAGFPKGVFNMVQGTKDCVEALIEHEDVKAVTFVGSSPIAEQVASKCRSLHKRCTALGGAKNHLVALPDCDLESTAKDVCVSFAGCAGQRCMAASVFMPTGFDNDTESNQLIQAIVENAKNLTPGKGPGQMGPVIDAKSYEKILSYINDAEKNGSKILLDGRKWIESIESKGNWIGPTIIHHVSKHDKTMRDEVFGPLLSIYTPSTWEEAIEIENNNNFGNAASIYTTNGGNSAWFCKRFRASMLGVNIGIPVPREPFSFGGLYGTKSKYGDADITGDGAMEFFSNRIKVTSKWPTTTKRKRGEITSNDKSSTAATPTDHANFAGTM